MKSLPNNSDDTTALDKGIVKYLVKDHLRTTYAAMLEKEYAVAKPKSKVIKIYPYLWKAAVFLLLTGSFLYFATLSPSNPSQMAMGLAKTTNVLGNQNSMRKDDKLLSEVRLAANDAFAHKKYDEAAQLYMKLTTTNDAIDLDHFYLALSSLKKSSPDAKVAIENLQKIKDTENLRSEIEWFLALAYCIHKDYKASEVHLQKVVLHNEYMSKEAQKLLNSIKSHS
jgi:hypothetical protein